MARINQIDSAALNFESDAMRRALWSNKILKWRHFKLPFNFS